MKKATITILFVLCLAYFSKGQNNNSFDSTKNEIGFSVVPFLSMVGFQITNPELIIQFKRHYDKKTLRLGLFIGNTNENNQDIKENVVNLKDTQVTFHKYNDYGEYEGLKIGMETSKKSAANWRFYYGGDILFAYKSVNTYDDQVIYKRNPDSSYTRKNENSEFFEKNDFFRIGISPIVGFEYFFSPGLSTAFQATINGFYEHEMTKTNPSSSISMDTYFSLLLNFHFTKK